MISMLKVRQMKGLRSETREGFRDHVQDFLIAFVGVH